MSKGLERLNNKNLPCSNCKELKRLEELKNRCSEAGITIDGYFKYLIVEDTIDNYKKLKALEIIIKHDIIISDFKTFNTFASFNQRRSLTGYYGITKEEYDLLKEVLL